MTRKIVLVLPLTILLLVAGVKPRTVEIIEDDEPTRTYDSNLKKEIALCDEMKDDSDYFGQICTLSNLNARKISYDYSRILQKELYFKNSVVPYFPAPLQNVLQYVQLLNMTGVGLRAIDQTNLRGAENLYILVLSRNKLKSLGSGAFSVLPLVDLLDLSYNRLREIDANAFKGTKNLGSLDLSHNNLETMDIDFNELPRLKRLNLSFNNIARLPVNSFQFLKNLLSINLIGNRVVDLRLKLCNEHKLELDATNNSLRELTLDWNADCQIFDDHSVELILSDNVVHSLNSDHQIRMTKLDVSYNGLTSIVEMAGFSSLEKLNISHNNVREVNFPSLRSLQYLKELDIAYNNLTELDVNNVLDSLPKLGYLGVKNNSWSCDVGDEISQTLDELDIETDVDIGDGTCKINLTDKKPEAPVPPQSDSEDYESEDYTDSEVKNSRKPTPISSTTEKIGLYSTTKKAEINPAEIDIKDNDEEYYYDNDDTEEKKNSKDEASDKKFTLPSGVTPSKSSIRERVNTSSDSTTQPDTIPTSSEASSSNSTNSDDKNLNLNVKGLDEADRGFTSTPPNSTTSSPFNASDATASTMLFTKPTRPITEPGDKI